MAKKRLFEDILRDPVRFYRVPGDVLRDRRFSDAERASILKAWRDADPERAEDIEPVLAEVESRGIHDAAE